MSDSTQEAARLRAELSAANDAALRFTASAAQMQSAYTYALNRMNSALSQLSGAFRGLAAVGMNAFSSLISAVTPAVQTLSNLAVKLFGATVWQSGTKAANATASAINSVAKAAKSAASAQRDLYGFDQITRVSASSGSGSSGGGSGGSSGGSSAAEGSWVRISGLLDDFAGRAKSILSQIWQPFADAWDSQGAGVVEAAQTALASIGSAAAAVGSSWLKAWTGGAGEQAVSSVLGIVQNLLTAVGNIAARFRDAWTAGGAGDAIFQDLADIANVFLDALEDMASSIWASIKTALTGAANGSKTAVVSAFTQMNSGAASQGNSLKTKLSGIFGTIVSNIQSKLSSVKTALTTPFKNGLNAVIDLVNRMINKVNSALKFSWSAIKVLGKVIVPAGSVTLAKLPTISRLAEGGVTTGPVFSLIGEAGREAVLPLERNTDWMDRLAERLAQAEGRQGDGLVLEVHVGDELLAKQVIRRVNETTRRTGRCPIYV
ncbi:MAG: hypothetical protein LIO45_07685 [Clostridiales bacterium]|nr:hypothetical protein [Clostridiales bacterium]